MKTNKFGNKYTRKNKIIGERTNFKTQLSMISHALQSHFLLKKKTIDLQTNKLLLYFWEKLIQHPFIYN